MYTVYLIKDLRSNKVVYVGKTNNFKCRKRQHLSLRAHTKDWIASIGVNNISITPIAEFNSKEEALKYEDEMILKYNTIQDGFNKNRSGLIRVSDKKAYNRHLYATNQDYRKNNLERQKQYYETNKADRLEYQNRYNQEHKNEIAEQKKRYRQEHKEQIAEQRKHYYHEHKEQLIEQAKMRYQRKKAQKQMQLDISNTPNGHLIQLTIPF